MTLDPAKISGMSEQELFTVLGNALSTSALALLKNAIEAVTSIEYSLGNETTFAELGINAQQKEKVLEFASQSAEAQQITVASNGPKPSTDKVLTIGDAINYILHIY